DRIARHPRLAERQQQLAVGAELEDLMALAAFAEPVGHPDIVLRVDIDPVRKDEHAAAEGFHQLARLVEFEDRIERGVGAGIGAEARTEHPALTSRHAAWDFRRTGPDQPVPRWGGDARLYEIRMDGAFDAGGGVAAGLPRRAGRRPGGRQAGHAHYRRAAGRRL